LLNIEGKKLSKRHGDVSVDYHKKAGYLPEAIINFLALLGWSPNDNREIFTLEELCKSFSLENINKANAKVDLEKLNWINAKHLRMLLTSNPQRLSLIFLDFLNSYSISKGVHIDKELLTLDYISNVLVTIEISIVA